ncbi:hypothetical protein Plhal304r1_c031g0101751 [Plasmopara halstedii]
MPIDQDNMKMRLVCFFSTHSISVDEDRRKKLGRDHFVYATNKSGCMLYICPYINGMASSM